MLVTLVPTILEHNWSADRRGFLFFAIGGILAAGELVFDKVTFAYGMLKRRANGSQRQEESSKNAGDEDRASTAPLKPIINDVTFRIKPGSFSAIVGESGSGKSTLFYMMLRLLEPVRGDILLGGQSLDQIPLGTLRDYIGFIPQAPFIFSGSIKENLLMGVPEEEVPAERIAYAVKLAKLEESVEKRKANGGLDAQVGGERREFVRRRTPAHRPGSHVPAQAQRHRVRRIYRKHRQCHRQADLKHAEKRIRQHHPRGHHPPIIYHPRHRLHLRA